MKIMAASFALGGVGLAGCRRPEANILPFGKSVEGVSPGPAALLCDGDAAAQVRRSRCWRRPTRAARPSSRATVLRAPRRRQLAPGPGLAARPLRSGPRDGAHRKDGGGDVRGRGQSCWPAIGQAYAANAGRRPGVSRRGIRPRRRGPAGRAELQRKVSEGRLGGIRAGGRRAAGRRPRAPCFGRDVKPIYRFAKAKRIVCLDADFLQAEAGGPVLCARVRARAAGCTKKDDPMNRLYVAESGFTLTGSHGRPPPAPRRAATCSRLRRRSPAEVTGRPTPTPALAAGARRQAGVDRGVRGGPAGEQGRVPGRRRARTSPPRCMRSPTRSTRRSGNIGRTVDFVAVEPATAATLQQLAARDQGRRGQDARHSRRKSRLQRPGGSRLAGAAEVGGRGRAVRLLRRRDLGARPARTSPPRTISNRGAMPARSTARSCRSSR